MLESYDEFREVGVTGMEINFSLFDMYSLAAVGFRATINGGHVVEISKED